MPKARRACKIGFKLAACLTVVAVSAAAANTESPGTPPAQAKLIEGDGTSFALLARAIASIDVGEPALVVVGPVAAAQGSPVPNAALGSLRQKLSDAVAAAVPLAKMRAPDPLTRAEARTQARRMSVPLVYLAPALISGRLQIEASVIKWPRSFWQRALSPEGATTTRLKVAVMADSLVRSHFPQPKKLLTQRVSYAASPRAPLALACGDLDGDGTDEISVLSREAVTIGNLDGGKFVIKKEHRWSDLSPVAAAPLRAPLGGLSMHPGRLRAGISDRAVLVEFDSTLKVAGTGPRQHPWTNGRCSPYTASGIRLGTQACPQVTGPGSPIPREPVPEDLPESADVAIAGQFTSQDGVAITLRGHVPPGSSQATFVVSSASERDTPVKIEDAGAVLHWADLDGDGAAEVITSKAGRDPAADGIRVHTLDRGRFIEVASLAGGPVHAVTTCPFSGANPLTIVAAIGNELWAIR